MWSFQFSMKAKIISLEIFDLRTFLKSYEAIGFNMLKSFLRLFKRRSIEKQKLEELTRRIEELEQDTHQREQAENALRHHLRLLDVLLNTIPNPVFYQDIEGVLQGCNLAFADDIIGLSREKVLGQSMTELRTLIRHRLPEKLFRQPIGPSSRSGVMHIEENINCADGRRREFLFSKAVIFEPDGEVSGSVGVMVDITERKKTEAEREQLIKELQEALTPVKTLRGLLPICSHCKSIRDDQGYWGQIEAYIGNHSEAEFSHGICPECAKKYYPDFNLYDE